MPIPAAVVTPISAIVRPRRESTSTWPLVDRLAYWLCWAVGIGLCVVAAGIALFMFIKGISALRPSLFVESPSTGALQERHSGGFLDPLIGTFILTAIGIGIAYSIPALRRRMWLANATAGGAMIVAAGVLYVVG